MDDQTVLAAGGWDSRYAVVRIATTIGDRAAAVVDANGDGADINLEHFAWLDGSWVLRSSSGGSGDEGTGWHDGMLAAHGRDEHGWWLTLDPSPAPPEDDRPPEGDGFGWFAHTS